MRFDTLVVNGRVVRPGQSARPLDLGVTGERIAAVLERMALELARRRVDRAHVQRLEGTHGRSRGADPLSADTVLIRAAAAEVDRPRLALEIERRVRAACEITVEVAFVPADHFAARFGDDKFTRFVDERPLTDRPT
jgi:hypothetical protein